MFPRVSINDKDIHRIPMTLSYKCLLDILIPNCSISLKELDENTIQRDMLNDNKEV